MSADAPVLLGSLPLLVLAVVLVVLAGALAAADAALGAVSSARVDALVRAGERGAERLAQVVADRPRHVNLLLLLRMACEVTATVLVAVVALRTLEPTWVAVLTAGPSMVVVSYVVVGVGPRTLGRQHPYTVATAAAGPVRVLGRVLGPLSRLLILLGNALTPGRGFREGPFSSEVELRELVDMAGARGVVETGEAEMIHSVFELGDTLAREVMVPRTEIVWVERGKSARQALALCLRSGFTRIPVIGENIDDVVGVVNVKDLARQVVLAGAASTPVAELLRPAEFVPDTKHLTSLLEEMQVSRNHMAVVVDEYGGTAGLLTIEDILEEIVGEITDEYDVEDRPPVEELPDGGVRVSSRLPVHDLGELFDVDLDDSDVETVGGLLARSLGRVPLPGAEAELAGLRMRAEGGNDRRGRLRITAVTVHRDGEERSAAPPDAESRNGHDTRDGGGARDVPTAALQEGSTGATRA